MFRSREIVAAVVATAAVVVMGAVAHADVVGPPPDDCPDGTTPESCHGGPYCAPDTCTTDADCSAGKTCSEIPTCVGSVVCAGMLPPDADIEDYRRDTVEGVCAEGTCESGECRAVRLCVVSSAAPVGGSGDGGCGCRVTSTGDTPAPALCALSGIALVWWRRRRR